MEHVLPAGKVFQAGTLSGNPLATAAGTTTLRLLREVKNPSRRPGVERPEAAWPRGCDRRLDRQVASKDVCVQQVGSMLTALLLTRARFVNWDDAAEMPIRQAFSSDSFWAMLDSGVYSTLQPVRGVVRVDAAMVPTKTSNSTVEAARARPCRRRRRLHNCHGSRARE